MTTRPPSRPLGAQISHMLAARGVDTIFGIPGFHNQEMYRGIEEAGITHVLARHEQGAGFMADGYARATGRPGVCYVITGPGLTNVLTPLGQAYSDSVPVLAISSCLDEVAATRGQLHQMRDQRAAAETVCDWSEEARTPEAAYHLIDRAFAEFETQRPRPKHLQVPIALLEGQAAAPPVQPEVSALPPGTRSNSVADYISVLLMKEAERPLFIFGGGVARTAQTHRAAKWIERLLKKSGAASFVTYAGRGLVDPKQPLFFGSSLARRGSREVIASADLVVAFGTELSEGDLWRTELGATGHMIRVDMDPTVMGDAGSAREGFVADALGVIQALVMNPNKFQPSKRWQTEDVALSRARWRMEVDAERPGVVPVADALRACLPEGTMIYSDMTQFAYSAKEVWDMDRPGHWHHPTGFGTLGYALPAAIGGAVARQGRPTMAIAGDYGFQYTLQELGTAVELQLPLPIFLWDNGKLKEIEDSMVAAQIPPNAVIARNPDFVALAKAYGANGVAPQTLPEMQDATRAAFDAKGPTLIHVRSDIGP
ncbi:MAG: 5-guanidino-2-oxopentanoate decarboxylase [Pseudomonadota bacterium]